RMPGLIDRGMSRKSLVGAAVAVALMGAQAPAIAGPPVVAQGVVAGSLFTPPAGGASSSSVPSIYAGAKGCFDWNDNWGCDPGEPSTISATTGKLALESPTAAPLVAEITTAATNGGKPVTQRTVLRAPLEWIAENQHGHTPVSKNVAVTPLSTEVLRSMEADGLPYSVEKDNIAERIGVASDDLLLAPSDVSD